MEFANLLRPWKISRVEEFTLFPTDPYHELVGSDLSCHECRKNPTKFSKNVGEIRQIRLYLSRALARILPRVLPRILED